MLDRPLGAEELASDIDLVEPVKEVRGYFQEFLRLADARVVHQDIDAAQEHDGLVHQFEAGSYIAQVSLETEVPVIMGVITADTLEQAIERAGSKMGNKGFEAATQAIEMANLLRNIS